MLWMHATVQGDKPTPREDSAWAYDAKTAKLVMLGGWNDAWLDDLYTLDVGADTPSALTHETYNNPMCMNDNRWLQSNARSAQVAGIVGPPYAVHSVDPVQGPVTGGTLVRVEGINFGGSTAIKVPGRALNSPLLARSSRRCSVRVVTAALVAGQVHRRRR
jgi:dynein heavy chain